MIPAEVPLAHLQALTDEKGLFEHALGDVPRREHGYCVDDVARGLALLFGIGTKALPGWDSKTRWNNL